MGFARFNRFDRLARFRVGYDLSTLASLQALQALFLPDDIAALFDYYNTAQLYEFANATTPAAVGSPVGALLDVSRGLELGPELSSVSTLDLVANGAIQNISIGTVTTGKFYRVRFTLAAYSGTGSCGFITTVFGASARLFGVGTVDVITPALGANAGLFCRADQTVSFTGISIRELKGNHAIQATTANKPTLRQTPQTGRYWLEAIDADRALNITFDEAPGTMYVGRVTVEGMEWTTETWGTTVNILRQNRYNAGIVARSRDWTAAEKALIAAYFARQMPTLGPNLFVNPGFDSDTDWTKSDGWSISGGVANKTNAAAAAGVTQNVATIGELALIGYTLNWTASNWNIFGIASTPTVAASQRVAYVGYANVVGAGPRGGAPATGSVDDAFYRRIL